MLKRRVEGALLSALLLVTTGLLAQSPNAAPAWQTAAGGSMKFEVASVRLNPGPFIPPNFPLSNDDAYRENGGMLTADFNLFTYITFAYKIRPSRAQTDAMLAHLPGWVKTDNYEVHARAASKNPTKNQMRLMMQDLLKERFGLVVHFENQDTQVLEMTLIKPGKPGPNLRPHSAGRPCDLEVPRPSPGASPKETDLFPPICDANMLQMLPNHMLEAGSRNTTMSLIADNIGGFEGAIVVDKTGLSGKYDFTLTWSPDADHPQSNPVGTPAGSEGPTVLEAVQEQLGIKLKQGRAMLPVLVIDHAERPSEN